MISRLIGRLLEKQPPTVVLDVHGVGYEIDVPMSTFYQLPTTGAEVRLFTHLIVREDAHLLYGFATEGERQVFRQLIKITGIGAQCPSTGDHIPDRQLKSNERLFCL